MDLFTLSSDAERETNVLASLEASLKRSGSYGIHQRAVANSPSSASQRSSPSARKGTVLKLTTVQFVNKLRLSKNGLLVNWVCLCVCVQSDKCWAAVVMNFNAYCTALPTGGRYYW